MFDRKLTSQQEQLLREQVIDLDHPGSVLRDFQTLVDYVGPDGLPAAGKYHLLPIDRLDELDQRLTRPLNLQMERPQLKSHPYLRGLHLLLRATGLGRVVGTGDRARLTVDPAVLEQWQRLNPTERYFNLLEAWLLAGSPEMVGERAWGSGMGLLSECLSVWQFITPLRPGGRANRPEEFHILGGNRDLYLLALMDLFGFAKVEYPRGPVKPWVPHGAQQLPLGDAVFTLLSGRVFGAWEGEEADEEDEEEGPDVAIQFGQWQPLFQPYFPEWQNNLTVPWDEGREGVFVFRVSLGQVWRRIAMPADSSLDELLTWVLKSVHFDHDHLYEFVYPDRFGATIRAASPYADADVSAADVRIGDLPLEPGDSMRLTYDFGDDWRFTVKLERIEPPGSRIKAPRIMESHGKAPKQYPRWE